MIIKIRYKLFLVLALISLASVFAMALSMHWNTQRNFKNYRQAAEQNRINDFVSTLERFYAQEQSWDELEVGLSFLDLLSPHKRRFQRHKSPPRRHGPPLADRNSNGRKSDNGNLTPPVKRQHPIERKPPPPRHFPPSNQRANDHQKLEHRMCLLDKDKNVIAGLGKKSEHLYPIIFQGATVGWLGVDDAIVQEPSPIERAFLKQERKAFYLASIIVSFMSLFIALVFSKQFERPLKNLATLARRLTEREFSARSKMNRKDEFGELSVDLNILANSLEKNEKMREQWIADTSHELRTPVTILQGEIELIRDRIREPTDEVLESLQEEINHLAKLIEDLNTLSLADNKALHFDMAVVPLNILLENVVQSSKTLLQEKKIELELRCENNILVEGDSMRLKQVFDNFLVNSSRYTDGPGTITIKMFKEQNFVVILFEDTPPCPTHEEITHLFERFYRTDTSRNRKSGGRGLGLAICKRIIEGHKGHIKAYAAASGGLGLHIRFPLMKEIKKVTP